MLVVTDSKCNVYGTRNTDWIILREDNPDFAAAAARNPDNVREEDKYDKETFEAVGRPWYDFQDCK